MIILLTSLACSLPLNFPNNKTEISPTTPIDTLPTGEVILTPALSQTITAPGAIPSPALGNWVVFDTISRFNSIMPPEEAQTWLNDVFDISANSIQYHQSYCLLTDFESMALPDGYAEQIGLTLPPLA